MAKKKSTSAKKAVPKKPVKPMFPRPEQVAYSFNFKDDIPGSVMAEMIAAIHAGNEAESRRMDLNGRLKECAMFCWRQVMPYFGERPSDITEEQWQFVDNRMGLIHQLPKDAPAEAHLALTLYRALQRMVRKLEAAGEFSDEIEHSLCLAIDLGMLIQRCEAQVVYGPSVAAGEEANRERKLGGKKTSDKWRVKRELTIAEYLRRRSKDPRPRMKTAILMNMAEVRDKKGNRIYGALKALAKYTEGLK